MGASRPHPIPALPRYQPRATAISSEISTDMVVIPAGEFTMGTPEKASFWLLLRHEPKEDFGANKHFQCGR